MHGGTPPAGAVVVTASDNLFTPQTVEAAAGEEITVAVRNSGDSAHNFVIPALNISFGTISPGSAVNVTFDMPDDEVEFVCTFHGGMTGRLLSTA